MNKNISLVLNLAFGACIIILFYLLFSLKQQIETNQVEKTDSLKSDIKFDLPAITSSSNILFINADSLFENYEYVKAIKKDAEAKQANLESRYAEKGQKLQQDYVDLQQKINAGQVNEEQVKKAEEDFIKRKEELEKMEKQLADLVDDTQKKNAQIQKEITEFFNEYAKDKNVNYVLAYTSTAGSVLYAKDSLNITTQLVDALNTRYKAKLQSAK